MSLNAMDEYWVPEHVKDYLRRMGFVLPLDDMEPWIRSWDDWMGARGSFYDYRDQDGVGRVYEVHRRSIHPAMRVCKEWGSLLLNEDVKVVSENQGVTDWLEAFLSSTNFMNAAQATVVRAFGLGTGAWALWVDLDKRKVRIRHYDARMVIPLTWDEDGVTECAFVTRAYYRGKAVDQLQMHLRGDVGLLSHEESLSADSLIIDSETYRIVTVCFDREGNEILPNGIVPLYDTGCSCPTFGIVKPAVTNTRVDMSPYGQSVFADAVDAIQAVDLTFDALISEIDLSKMRIFLSDVLFDRSGEGNKSVTIPFGKQDCTVFRKVMSTEDTIQEFAPALRTSAQKEAFRVALQMLGDLCGFGIDYFDLDDARGYVRTATEVSSDNSALMRNIRRHENSLEGAITDISKALITVSRSFGENIPDEGVLKVAFDDSIIQDTAAEKAQDMSEVGVTLNPFEYRMRWYSEDEQTARARAAEIGTGTVIGKGDGGNRR
ncbi:MAG: hypothetical protein J6D54_03470 [Olsenella sp.]|nr:hypothetical protein [Olsenella sp.]